MQSKDHVNSLTGCMLSLSIAERRSGVTDTYYPIVIAPIDVALSMMVKRTEGSLPVPVHVHN